MSIRLITIYYQILSFSLKTREYIDVRKEKYIYEKKNTLLIRKVFVPRKRQIVAVKKKQLNRSCV